ncbi:pyruvate formate lyase family protein [Salipaludibacillus daqingensis]|uniref:pyruvate formate lyase family protein n=1 Tax=Salipaludibacillus daqingensis TaxID=3041001 RepID=UPI0024738824|nr:pyruvate formate lyase family protein [Salipaludibacillus daqingensis]
MQTVENFKQGVWCEEIDVRDFILRNMVTYKGNDDFLESPTNRTNKLWEKVQILIEQEEIKNGMLDIDTKTVSTITSHDPGYIDKNLEIIVGLQTDEPLKRGIIPYDGIQTIKQNCEHYGYKLDSNLEKSVLLNRKTHQKNLLQLYSEEMKLAKHAGVFFDLPDTQGRGKIIGDYRRIALYGVDRLIRDKWIEREELEKQRMLTEDVIRQLEEVSEQIQALFDLKQMALSYGFNISHEAKTAKEAFQWIYFGFLAAIKEQNGLGMSIGRISTFLDIYIERDLEEGLINESQAQELVDQFVMKLRLVRFLRTPLDNHPIREVPMWITESIGGIAMNGVPMITKTSYRFLHTLTNLGPSPEPNLTVLWSTKLPNNFKNYCAKTSIKTSSIQYENDDRIRAAVGDDYAIGGSVSVLRIGKEVQYFGGVANFGKALLYAINGGQDEVLGEQVAPEIEAIKSDYLDFDEVIYKFDKVLAWLASLYVKTLNMIHYSHDKYAYERMPMALHDHDTVRKMGLGVSGLSVVADSLSAIKYAKVRIIRGSNGLSKEFEIEGDFPKYGNNDTKVDELAIQVTNMFLSKLQNIYTYRFSLPLLSVCTMSSNIISGQKTGSTPDGRKAGLPFAPGADPMHGRDQKGALASLSSIAKISYDQLKDGTSCTFSISPKALGSEKELVISNLIGIINGYMDLGGHHMNVNIINREHLIEAMKCPDHYPQITIRVSGYACNFIKLRKDQQLDVIYRTCHLTM